jgi:hypothetical protein
MSGLEFNPIGARSVALKSPSEYGIKDFVPFLNLDALTGETVEFVIYARTISPEYSSNADGKPMFLVSASLGAFIEWDLRDSIGGELGHGWMDDALNQRVSHHVVQAEIQIVKDWLKDGADSDAMPYAYFFNVPAWNDARIAAMDEPAADSE